MPVHSQYAFEKDSLHFDLAGIVMEFLPEVGKLILKQGGQTFEMTREPKGQISLWSI